MKIIPTNKRVVSTSQFILSLPLGHLLALSLLVGAASASAGNLTWDAGNTNNGAAIDPADGTWDTATPNWNNGSGNVLWTQTSTTAGTTGAIFGGADGTYAVTIPAQVAMTNLLFNNSGYTLSGSPIWVINNSSGGVVVADGKTATIACNFAQGQFFKSGVGSILNLSGTMSSIQPRFVGPGAINISSSPLNISVTYVDANVTLSSPCVCTPSSTIQIGYGASFGGVNYTAGSLTVDGATINQNADKIIIARSGGTGTLTLQNNGTINFGTTKTLTFALGNNDASANNHATVNVNSGTLTVGSATYPSPIQMMSGGSQA